MKTICLSVLMLAMLYAKSQTCLVGYYPLNGNLQDSVTTASGTNSGAIPSADRSGNASGAMYFNGSASALLVDDYDYPVRTVALWFKQNVPSTIHAGLYETDHANVINSQTELAVKYNANGTNYISFYIGGSGNQAIYTINNNQWYHIAAVRDISQIRYYVDCNLVATGSTITNSHSSAGVSAAILGNASTGSYYFNGSLDELRLYNCALTANEITGICGTEVGLTEHSSANGCFNSSKVNLQLTDEQYISKVFELNEVKDKASITIYNAIGQVVFTGACGNGSALSIPELKNGIYYYRLTCDTHSKSGTIHLAKP